jgi:hypothetical protein
MWRTSDADERRVILLEPAAPPQPRPGAPCNGCGVCCTWAPCPLGVLLSLRLRGRCRMLRWNAEAGRYHCGALAPTAAPAADRPTARSASAHRSPARLLIGLRTRWVRRWIAAGEGCDCTLQRVTPDGDGT